MSNRDRCITIGIMVVMLALIMSLLIGDGTLNAWSEQRINTTVSAAVNPYVINYYLNGTVLMENYPLGLSGMWLGRVYILGFTCILTAGLVIIGGELLRRKVPSKFILIMSGFGSFCLCLSLLIWIPAQNAWNAEFALTVNWCKLLLLSGGSCFGHFIALMTRPNHYIEI